jgi:hypothetical protein
MLNTSVSALEIIAEEDVLITTEQTSDIVIAWGEVNIQSTLHQDAIIAGWDLLINAPILQDLIFAGWDVSINEEVKDDIRWIGWNITIDSNVAGDVILAAWDIRIKKGVTIWGDLIIAAGKATIDWDVLWKFKFAWGELKLNGTIWGDAQIYVDKFKSASGSNASIWWNLDYRSELKNEILESITKGSINYKEAIWEKQFKKDIKESIMSYIIVKILFIFIFSTVLFFFFQKFYKRTGKILAEKTGKSFLYGLLTFLLIPILAILFFISVIGVPIGILLVFWFVMLIIFLEVINVTVLTALIINKFPKLNVTYIKVLIILILSIIMAVISGIDIIIWFFTVWSTLILKKEIIAKFRNMD